MPDFTADQFRPPLGDFVTALLVFVAVAALLWLYVRRQGDVSVLMRFILLSLRLGAMAVVAWILMGPSAQTSTSTLRRRLPLLILSDTSASMQQGDVDNFAPLEGEEAGKPITRWQALTRTWLDPAYVARLDDLAEVQIIAFDQDQRRLSIDQIHTTIPDGAQTRVYESVRGGLETQEKSDEAARLSGLVLLLSDGHDTQREVDPTFAAHMTEAGWRIMAVPVGSPLGVRHITVDASADADFLFENQSTWINVQVRQSGFEHRQVRVELQHEGKLIDATTLAFDDESSRQLRFRVTPPPPPAATARSARIEGYRVVATPVALPEGSTDQGEEAFLDNNNRWVFLQVSTDRMKVAMFEAQPYWDTKFLARVLREDPQIELTSVYSLASGRIVTVQSNVKAGTLMGETEEDYDPLWLTLEQLNKFDVVILGKGAEQFFGGDRAQWLVDYVQQRGGALVLARGRPFNLTSVPGIAAQAIFNAIEPVEWGVGAWRDLQLQVAPEGRSSELLQFERLGETDAILSELPDMLAATRIRREKALSIVLLRQAPARQDAAPSMAAIAHSSAGSGRVLAVLSDGMWRWAFLPTRLQEYDSVYQAFWARTIRWLATGGQFLPGQSMSMSLSALKVEPDESVQVTVNTRYVESPTFTPHVQIIAPDGQVRQVALARHSDQSTQFDGTIKPDQPGVHQVVLTAEDEMNDAGEPVKITGRLAVHDRSDEKRDPSARPQILAEMCQATGGRCFDLSERQELVRLLDQLHQARRTDTTWDFVFNRGDVFALLALLLGLEWIMRRRSGLL